MGFTALGLKAAGLGMRAAIGLAKRPMVAGAAIGGLGGYFGSDHPQLSLEEGLRGAAQGAVGGLLLAKAPGMLWRNRSALAKGGWGLTKTAAKLGRFAFEHPFLVGGGVGAAYAFTQTRYARAKSPTLEGVQMSATVDQQKAASMELTGGTGMVAGRGAGAASIMMGAYHQDFTNSASGLVQGLYRSRHG